MEIRKVQYTKDGSKDMTASWWATSESEMHEHVFATVSALEGKQATRHSANIRHARLYQGFDVVQGTLASTRQNPAGALRPLSFNLIRSSIDTLGSKIAKAKPRPFVVTDGGDWSQQNRAEKLQKYIDGKAMAVDLYQLKRRQFVDSGVFGTGAIKFYLDQKKGVMAERAIIDEIIVDDLEAMYGNPRTLYQRRYASRSRIIELFPKHEKLLASASSAGYQPAKDNVHADIICVVEAWRLGEDGKPGTHGIFCDSCTLHVEDYALSQFPFSFFRFSDPLSGFFGTGVAEELLPIQNEITQTMLAVQKVHRLNAIPRIYYDRASKIDTNSMTNEIGTLIPFSGAPPIESQGLVMPPQVYAYIESLIAKGFNQIGVSQLSANSQKPAGLNSGVGLREYSDIESERFAMLSQRWEESFIHEAKLMIEMTKQAAEIGANVDVKVAGDKYAEIIKWREVKMDQDQYILKVFPASSLPQTPGARKEYVIDMLNAQMIDPDTGRELLELPDIEAESDIRYASRKLTRQLISRIVETESAVVPEPYLDLDYAEQYAQLSYLRYSQRNAPDSVLELIRTFISDCQALKAQAASAQAMLPQGVPAQTPGPQPSELPLV